MGTYVLITLAALIGCVVIGSLLGRLWEREEQHAIGRKWEERERLLDRRRVASWHEIRKRHSRPAGTLDVPKRETAARVLYIVARDQPELLAFLRQDFAAEEAEGVIAILMNRRHRMQPCEADGRDPRRNWDVTANLREMGFALVRQPQPLRQGNAPAGSSFLASSRTGAGRPEGLQQRGGRVDYDFRLGPHPRSP